MWRAVGGAVQGSSHLKSDIPCQDKIYKLEIDGGIIAALADGAGSAKLSHYGAERVTKTICEFIGNNYDRLFSEDDGKLVKQELIEFILNELETVCEEQQCEKKDLASTLLIVAIKNDTFILAHLGDGVIGYLKGEELRIASTPDNGEFVNETVFTTSANALSSLQLKKGILGEIIGFIMMSDGPEVSLYDKRTKQLANGIKNVMLSCSLLSVEEANENLHGILEDTLKKRTTDDCSLLFVVDKERVIKKLLSNEEYKRRICGISSNKSSKKKWTLKRFKELLEFIREPKTTDQIAKHFYTDKKYVKRKTQSLQQYGIIQFANDYYHSVITFDENE